MMFEFKEISKDTVYTDHNQYYHEDARYFTISKDGVQKGLYGVISRGDHVGEAFLMFKYFTKNTVTKEFFCEFFNHLFSLDYKKVLSWTRCPKLVNILRHFKTVGIEEISHPVWDEDETKFWFMRRV